MKKLLFISMIAIAMSTACVSDKEQGLIVSDGTLFGMSRVISSYAYFNLSTDTLSSSSGIHGPYIRVRFNPKARTVLNDSLNRLTVASFPDESMVVKEVYNNKGGPLIKIEIMYKLHNAANNGSGWIWSELDAAGNVMYTSALKGDECKSCHSAIGNSDLVEIFSMH